MTTRHAGSVLRCVLRARSALAQASGLGRTPDALGGSVQQRDVVGWRKAVASRSVGLGVTKTIVLAVYLHSGKPLYELFSEDSCQQMGGSRG